MAKIATPRQVSAAFGRMIEALEAQLVARKTVDAESVKPDLKTVERGPGAADSQNGIILDAKIG